MRASRIHPSPSRRRAVSRTRIRVMALAAMLWAVSAAIPAAALDAAPYTREAARRLTRAADSVEPARPGSTKAETTKRLIATLDEMYRKAGYSFEKSLLRYLAETEHDGHPPLVNEAEALAIAYDVLSEAEQEGVPMDAVFAPAIAREVHAKLANIAKKQRVASAAESDAINKRTEKLQAEDRASEAADAERRAGIDREKATEKAEAAAKQREAAIRTSEKWSHWVQDRYTFDVNPQTFMDLAYVTENVYRVSGERYQQGIERGSRGSLCKLPATEIAMDPRGNLLRGSGNASGCEVELILFSDGRLQITPKRSPACDSLCANGTWTSLSLRSQNVKERGAREATGSAETETTPAQRELSEELARREQPAASAPPSPPRKDASQEAVDALRDVARGLFKR
jgi:hypothetical protein